MTTIAINGFGRMGRLALRAAWGGPDLTFVHVNELHGDAATAAHLLEFDSVHGRWDRECAGRRATASRSTARALALLRRTRRPASVPWGELGVDIVLECTGRFRTPETLAPYFERGVRKVIVAAPVKDDGALNVVIGVNDDRYDPDAPRHRHRRVVHDQLPGAGRQGHPRGHRHPPRLDHDAARHHEHADDRRRAAQGPAPRARARACR